MRTNVGTKDSLYSFIKENGNTSSADMDTLKWKREDFEQEKVYFTELTEQRTEFPGLKSKANAEVPWTCISF